jgi:hypothetical protein
MVGHAINSLTLHGFWIDAMKIVCVLKLSVLAANSPAVEHPPCQLVLFGIQSHVFFFRFLVFLSITPQFASFSLDSARSGREPWHAVMLSSHSFEA